MSGLTGTWTELAYASIAPGTAKNTFTAEAQINDTAGMGVQAHIPPDFWLPNQAQNGRGIGIVARGLISSTGTPNFTWTIRLGSAGSTTAAIVLGTSALATISGASNAIWEMKGEILMNSIGAAGTNTTVRGIGTVISSGLATVVQPAWGGAASTGLVTTVDTSITNYINFNAACSASSASNQIQILELLVFGLN